jgi:spore germination protein YaaH
LVSTAHANGVRVILSVNLHDFSTSSTSTICSALYPTRRATTISQIAAQVSKMGVDGVNIDYEGSNTTCQYGYTLQSAITSLAAEFRAKLPKAYIAIDTYSGSAYDTAGFFNIAQLEPYVNAFFVMAYDMEYSNYARPPLSCSTFCIGPTSPLTVYHYNDTSVMDQYMRVAPASKVILGVPYYGRKECVANVTPTTAPPNARAVSGTVASDGYLDASTEDGYSLNSDYHAHRETLDVAGYERWDTWTSSSAKCTREMYWDDVDSLSRKYDLVNKDGLGGVGIFALQYGGGAPELWQALRTKFLGCSSASVTATPPSPQPPGAVIQFAATASGCSKPTYEFWLQSPSGTWTLKKGWGTGTWTWDTKGAAFGTYTLHVWANQTGDPNKTWQTYAELKFTLATLPDCDTATLAPASATQVIASTVSFTATSTGCSTPMYEYWLKDLSGKWAMKRAFSLDPTWSWGSSGLRPGTYTIHVWANQYGHSTAALEAVGESIITLTGCTSASLDPASPSQPAGSTVAFTATSGGCPNPQYEYWVQYPNGTWYMKRTFGTDPAWSWNTSGLAPGTYTVHVWANQQGAYTGALEVFGSSTVTLTGCATASLSPLNPTLLGGSTISFSATSTGCPNPQYEYWVKYPNGTWYMKRAFSTDPTWKWNTTGLALGAYTVRVWANQQGAYTGLGQAIGSSTVRLAPPCKTASISPSTGSTAAGGTVTFTASATGCPNPLFEFWLQWIDGTWHRMTGFGGPTWTWTVDSSYAKGVYHIHVWANEPGGSTSTYQGLGAATRTVI